jgi:hypothetical protein
MRVQRIVQPGDSSLWIGEPGDRTDPALRCAHDQAQGPAPQQALWQPCPEQAFGWGIRLLFCKRSRGFLPLLRLESGRCGPAASRPAPVRLDGGDVRCLQTLRARRDLEFNRLAFVERSVTLRLDG